jgi:SAM-dependent methyltransferase
VDPRLAANQKMWDERVPVHAASAFYDVDGFRAGRTTLERFEIDEVGNVTGRRLLHLQCHFGLDTLSWARLGAEVTGLDFSGAAIDEARRLAADVGLDDRATFVESTVDDARAAVEGLFDIVYVSWGALIWLPDLRPWARNITDLLRPGGFLYLAEGHPLTGALKSEGTAFVEAYPYDGAAEVAEVVDGTYTDGGEGLRHQEYEWCHGLGEIVSTLVGAGMRMDFLHERPVGAWPMLAAMERQDDGLWRIPGSTLPLSYSLKATRP